jgi:hypothetical protein
MYFLNEEHQINYESLLNHYNGVHPENTRLMICYILSEPRVFREAEKWISKDEIDFKLMLQGCWAEGEKTLILIAQAFYEEEVIQTESFSRLGDRHGKIILTVLNICCRGKKTELKFF